MPTGQTAGIEHAAAPVAFRLRRVGRRFVSGGGIEIESLDIPCGAVVAVMGLSGSGKSTMLSILGGLASPQAMGEGARLEMECEQAGQRIAHDLLALGGRRRFAELGFVFQDAHLLRNATALTNIAVALKASKSILPVSRIIEIGDDMNLAMKKLSSRARQLSGGEKQRAAVGRGIAREPQIVLADEPTANLDPDNGVRIMSTICQWQRQDRARRTVLWVTHNVNEASLFADHIVLLAPPPDDGEEGQPPGRLMPGFAWPMENPHDPAWLRAMLTQAPSVPAPSAETHERVLDERDAAFARHVSRREELAHLDGSSQATPVEPFGPTAIRRIAWAELFGSARADTLTPPGAMSRLVGRSDAFIRSDAIEKSPVRRLLCAAAVMLGLGLLWWALYRPDHLQSLLTDAPGWLDRDALPVQLGLVLVLAGLAPLLWAFGQNLFWALLAFDRWFQLIMFMIMALFVYALVLARDALEAKFVGDLHSLDLGHIVISKAKRRGSDRFDQQTIDRHDSELRSFLEASRRPSTWPQQLSTSALQGLATLNDQVLIASAALSSALLPGPAAERASRSIADHLAARSQVPGPAVFGRWTRTDTDAVRRANKSTVPEEACSRSSKRAVVDVVATATSPFGEPAFGVMRYLGQAGKPSPFSESLPPARLGQLVMVSAPAAVDLSPDVDNIHGVVVSENFLRHRLGYADAEVIDPVFCLFGGGERAHRLVRIAHVVKELPKEQLVPEFHVLVSHDLFLDVYREGRGDASRTPEYETEAMYLSDPRQIGDYIRFFRNLINDGAELPDAFRQISKGLETIKTITDMATVIIYGVIAICLVIVTFITYGFIQQNEKSLCVMRAFGVSASQIAKLVAMQTVMVWLLAAAAACVVVLALEPSLVASMLDSLQVASSTAEVSRRSWLGYIAGLTFLIVLMSSATVLYWWRGTTSIGDRLKQLD